ncbi:hypothetical protein M422DRAFT_273879 [Sphaerobolus stellatus SS14]|uniref:Uncharacterized protein n=1 Tax=Sphaerobolus stellatus (strain SS14) TaxID=990650 RepID=A0A0C9UIF4_SPHS4|nr:hypothetical protein M422DRAFT_273879 [Sphaerobolus stellatus SS14]
MPSVPQNVIPGHPSISFDSYTTSEAGPAIARHFNSESSEAQAVGISTRMSTDGKVKSLDIWDCPLDEKDDQYAILRAYMCSYAMQLERCQSSLQSTQFVDTGRLSKAELGCLAESQRQ